MFVSFNADDVCIWGGGIEEVSVCRYSTCLSWRVYMTRYNAVYSYSDLVSVHMHDCAHPLEAGGFRRAVRASLCYVV